MRLKLKVKANAKKSFVSGQFAETLKVNVAAPAVQGKANDELIRLLADTLNVPRSTIRIVSGYSNSSKVVEIDAVDQESIKERLG